MSNIETDTKDIYINSDESSVTEGKTTSWSSLDDQDEVASKETIDQDVGEQYYNQDDDAGGNEAGYYDEENYHDKEERDQPLDVQPYNIYGNDDDYDIDDEGKRQLVVHRENTLPKKIRKFYHRRYELFSLYDKGIHLTTELWYSVTPEKLAIVTAKIIKKLLPQAEEVLDLCCGGGGNTIHFAKNFNHVGAIDVQQINVNCTLHNAKVYEVDDKIWSVTGNWVQLCKTHDWLPERIRNRDKPFDFIFTSPPWGGIQYNRDEFNLFTMQPLGLKILCRSLFNYSDNFGLFLPKSSDRQQISMMTTELFGDQGVTKIIELYHDSHFTGIMVLFGKDVVKDIDYHELFDDDDDSYCYVETEADYQEEMRQLQRPQHQE